MREEELSAFRDSVRSAANSVRRDSQARVGGGVCADGMDGSNRTDGSDRTDWADAWVGLAAGSISARSLSPSFGIREFERGGCMASSRVSAPILLPSPTLAPIGEGVPEKRRPRRTRLEAARVWRIGSGAEVLVREREPAAAGRTEKETMRACWSWSDSRRRRVDWVRSDSNQARTSSTERLKVLAMVAQDFPSRKAERRL